MLKNISTDPIPHNVRQTLCNFTKDSTFESVIGLLYNVQECMKLLEGVQRLTARILTSYHRIRYDNIFTKLILLTLYTPKKQI